MGIETIFINTMGFLAVPYKSNKDGADNKNRRMFWSELGIY